MEERKIVVVEKVHRVMNSNTHKYLKVCCKECVQEFFCDLKLSEKISEGLMPLKCSKGEVKVIS